MRLEYNSRDYFCHFVRSFPLICIQSLGIYVTQTANNFPEFLYASEIIGNARITYTFYPSGTVNIEVKCSKNPFKLETEIDRSHILVFFGQLRDRLITFLNDPHERNVPDVMEWFLTECDISRDIKVSNWLHYTGIKVQVKHLDHLFRIYVKSMGKDTVCRVEEEKHPDKTAIEAINEIFNPYERVEKQLASQNKILHQILDKFAQHDFTTEERP